MNVNELFKEDVRVINLGLPSFADDLKKQGIPVLAVDWKPPAGGNRKTLSILNRIKGVKK